MSLTRRTFCGAAVAAPFLHASVSAAEGEQDGLIAIIDTVDNAALRIQDLRQKRVHVVARYYARDRQPGLATKRMAFNGVGALLEPQVLIQNQFSILSVYQFNNNQREKFFGKLPQFVTGSPKAEADADAQATLAQSEAVKQAHGSAVYIGVDFNLDETDAPAIAAVLEYFNRLKDKLNGRFELGVYGNGVANLLLRGLLKDKLATPLVKYSWLSASPAHHRTAEFFTSGQWHLFQNQVDRRWFVTKPMCKAGMADGGMDVDTNVQNPSVAAIGAWGNGEVPTARTRAIAQQRRFVRWRTPVFRTTSIDQGLIAKRRCVVEGTTRKWVHEDVVDRARNVRVVREEDKWCYVDIDDDGMAEGYCLTADLMPSLSEMPSWQPPERPL
jgi:hypothetical protein